MRGAADAGSGVAGAGFEAAEMLVELAEAEAGEPSEELAEAEVSEPRRATLLVGRCGSLQPCTPRRQHTQAQIPFMQTAENSFVHLQNENCEINARTNKRATRTHKLPVFVQCDRDCRILSNQIR